jgi:phosphoglycolate/pyridoxal phosphate phosphatase family enzyme
MLFILDLDGVIYRGSQVLPHAPEAVAQIRSDGHAVFFLTNNSARSRHSYAQKLTAMGVPAHPNEIMSSSYATALYLEEHGMHGCSVLVVGEEGIPAELSLAGVRFVEPTEDAIADCVVVGIDRRITYRKLRAAQHAILNGAKFIATNADATYPLENGGIEPGGGAIVAAIQTCTGTAPIVIGKPQPYSVLKILELTSTPPRNAVIVGDRLDTDIALGRQLGIRSVLVLTGVTTREQVHAAPEEMSPDLVLPDLRNLVAAVAGRPN